ncbi:MAG: MaoC family dehydratase N-terminal domain-containing protein, partial [Rhodobacteraceae bacterium]|nr:MaoC family dehydratase N-terminal domain-containing protein [Paracoccaceae bacterium]
MSPSLATRPLEDWVGHVFEPHEAQIERGRLRLFAAATGETNPVHTDEVAAPAAGFSAQP